MSANFFLTLENISITISFRRNFIIRSDFKWQQNMEIFK